MQPAKPRKWADEETKLLIELAHRKESASAIARELGRHIASVKRRARELGLFLPPGRVRSGSQAAVEGGARQARSTRDSGHA
jgi:hypothetical protein